MLKFMKNFFGFGPAEPAAAPYKVETPAVNTTVVETPVVNTPQPMVNGRKPVKKAPASATGNAPAKKPVAKKKPPVKKK